MLGQFVNLLLSRNDLSHQDLQDFADWSAIDEEAAGWLSKSQISTIKNGLLPKPGAQLFLALSCVNQRLAELCPTDGQRPVRPPLPATLRKLAVEPGPWYLAHPTTGQPCDEGDLFRIYCGALAPPDLSMQDLQGMSTEKVRQVCNRLALLAQEWMKAQDFPSLKSAREALLELYPVKDQESRKRIWNVIQEEQVFTPHQFQQEQDALRFLVGRLQQDQALSVREFDRWLAEA